MKKMLIVILALVSLCVPSCIHWNAKEEVYKGSTLTIETEGRASTKSSSTKSFKLIQGPSGEPIKVIQGKDGKFYQVK